jgi:hypothetical protein
MARWYSSSTSRGPSSTPHRTFSHRSAEAAAKTVAPRQRRAQDLWRRGLWRAPTALPQPAGRLLSGSGAPASRARESSTKVPIRQLGRGGRWVPARTVIGIASAVAMGFVMLQEPCTVVLLAAPTGRGSYRIGPRHTE